MTTVLETFICDFDEADKKSFNAAVNSINLRRLQNTEDEVLSWQIVNECNLTNKQSMLLYSVLMRCGFKLVNDLSKGLVLLPDDDGDAKLIELQSLVRTSKKRKRKEILADDDVQPVLKKQKLNAIRQCLLTAIRTNSA